MQVFFYLLHTISPNILCAIGFVLSKPTSFTCRLTVAQFFSIVMGSPRTFEFGFSTFLASPLQPDWKHRCDKKRNWLSYWPIKCQITPFSNRVHRPSSFRICLDYSSQPFLAHSHRLCLTLSLSTALFRNQYQYLTLFSLCMRVFF